MMIHLIAGQIKKKKDIAQILYKLSKYFPKPYESYSVNVKVELGLSN